MRASLACLLLLAGSAFAEAPSPERQTLERFGIDNPACHEWTDGCAVCQRQPDKSFGCSLPGISCQPGTPSCNASDAPKR